MNQRTLIIFTFAVMISAGGAFRLSAQPEEPVASEGNPTMPMTERADVSKDTPMPPFGVGPMDFQGKPMMPPPPPDGSMFFEEPMAFDGIPMAPPGHRWMGPPSFRAPMRPRNGRRPFIGAFSDHPRWFASEPPKARAFRRFLGELQLSEEQQKEIVTIFEKHQKSGSKKAQNFLDMHAAMTDLLQQEDFDEQRVRELFRKQASQWEEGFVERTKMLAEIKKVLSPEQISVMQKKGEAFFEMMERWYGAGQ